MASPGLPAGLIRRMVPMTGRRDEFEPGENEAIHKGESQFMTPILQSDDTPISELLASPGKQSLTTGALLAAAGGLLGHQTGQHVPPLLGADPHPIAGAAIGAGTLGLLGALYQYVNRSEHNKDIKETMRRLPPNATKRDMESESALREAFQQRFGG